MFILRWAIRALPASDPSAGERHVSPRPPQVDLKCGSGRSCALYFLGEVFCESAGDGEQPFLSGDWQVCLHILDPEFPE